MAGNVEYSNALIAPGILELDHASETLHIGEYSTDEITIGKNDLSNLKVRGERGDKKRTARNRMAAAPQARMKTTFIGSMVSVA